MFTAEQKAALSADLDKRHVKDRTQSGRTLSFVEAWHVIAEANRIFGFDAWSSHTVELKCVSEREREIGQNKTPGWGVTYTGRVCISVGDIMREGVGAGHGIDRDLGLAHESAIKEAESDARKRALMTFGNPFGLALYDKTQAHVSNGDTSAPAAKEVAPTAKMPTLEEQAISYVKAAIKSMKISKTERDLLSWWDGEHEQRVKYKLLQNKGPGLDLKMAFEDLKDELRNSKSSSGNGVQTASGNPLMGG